MDNVIFTELSNWFSHLETTYEGLTADELKKDYIEFFNIKLTKKTISKSNTKNKIKNIKKEREPLEDSIRCIALKKDNTRCSIRKLKNNDKFCMTHEKNTPSKTILDQEEVEEQNNSSNTTIVKKNENIKPKTKLSPLNKNNNKDGVSINTGVFIVEEEETDEEEIDYTEESM
jgi:Fe-S-cluster containining protein